MFAAAKKGKPLGRRSAGDCKVLKKKGSKNFFQKTFKKYCGKGKRVLYLHPLSKETSWGKKKRSS
ncbi:hypothetical protein CSW08_09425 [Confluentibacter flavum]|uniref:Uncharacterized protein n=1 Tax=Confluentibacter flavum TaxID=1909700 RepID=A0A2N3HJF3_9FLAO|nr:hypothetical protein CSW08_09425 [Confluentibacter flavum]